MLLFQKLKDAKKNPVFMLKHIKDIRSPIAVAQQKQAARKASATDGGSAKSTPTPGASGHAQSHGQHLGQSPSQDGRGRPPKLQVNSHLPNQAPGIMTAVPNGQSGWPELMSPMVEHKVDFGADASKAQGDAAGAPEASESGTPPILREMPPASEVSYAVAIYPYMAEQEDEFDVIVCVVRFLPLTAANVPRAVAIRSSSFHEQGGGGSSSATPQEPAMWTKIHRSKVGSLQVVYSKPKFPSLPQSRKPPRVEAWSGHRHLPRQARHRSYH